MTFNHISNSAFRVVRTALCALMVLTLVVCFASQGYGQNNNNNNRNNNNNNNSNNNRNNNNNNNNNNNYNDGYYNNDYYRWGYRSSVGGVKIDANNVLRNATQVELRASAAEMIAQMEAIPSDLEKVSKARKISLKRLDALLKECAENDLQISDAARYLGGLTSIDYVVADPEANDIYLVGAAEPWTLGLDGSIVGAKSGKPVFQLEDLMTAMRALTADNHELISCSIDPTQEALVRLASLENMANTNANVAAMGDMNVTLTGVPADSRMANVLVAADYRLKRVSLGFDETAVRNFKSYFSMIRPGASRSFAQRFWMEPKYETLYRDADSLVWKVSSSSVNVLTEREYFNANGDRKMSGKVDAIAEKFARTMNNRYDEIAKAEPVFAEAKNCMDVALVAALIYRENLQKKAGCELSELTGATLIPAMSAPSSVASDSVARFDGKGIVSVTGGVIVNPWEALENQVKVDERLNSYAVNFTSSKWYED